ncbi:MAG: glycosyltransferase family 39 protein [archaeon]
MVSEEKAIEKRAEKIKKWFSNPLNLILIGILIFALGIRIYYWTHTAGQTLWWDEAEYMSTAKKWAFGVPYDLNPQRPPLFQAISALAFMIGLGEQFIKFAFVLLPSLLLVFSVYLLGREMYNQKIGLIAAFLASVSWTFLFWTSRVQPDFFSMSFQVLSVLFMWKYWKNEKVGKFAVYAGVFAALGFYFKVSGLLVPLIIAVFGLLKDRLSAFKIKGYYYFAVAFIVSLIPYFIWSYVEFGTLTAFREGYSNAVGSVLPFGWYTFNFFYTLSDVCTFILFLIGLVLSLKFLLYLDVLARDKNRVFDGDIFGVITLVIVSAFYIFYIRGAEDRWVYLWLPFIFFFVGRSLEIVGKSADKLLKNAGIVLIIILLLVSGYLQVSYSNQLIDSKFSSYSPVKDAGIWVKENSLEGDRLLSISYTQSTYYSERNVSSYSSFKNGSEFDNYLEQNRPKLIQVSIFEPHPEWIYTWTQINQNRLKPFYVSYGDAQKKQPNLVVYEIAY